MRADREQDIQKIKKRKDAERKNERRNTKKKEGIYSTESGIRPQKKSTYWIWFVLFNGLLTPYGLFNAEI